LASDIGFASQVPIKGTAAVTLGHERRLIQHLELCGWKVQMNRLRWGTDGKGRLISDLTQYFQNFSAKLRLVVVSRRVQVGVLTQDFPGLNDILESLLAQVIDPVEELVPLIEGGPNQPAEKLPAIIAGGPLPLTDTDEEEWMARFKGLNVANTNIASSFGTSVGGLFDNWLVVMLTGAVAGAVIGIGYRWMLLPT
jgi:hypothetical protein